MDTKKYLYLVAMGFVSLFLMSGCSAYGKLKSQFGYEDKVTIEGLKENWDDYTIHYAEMYVGKPAAIMFDPKEDGKTLAGDKWIKVEDQETLSDIISRMERARYGPRLRRVLGPDDQFYGYLFSFRHRVVTKSVDDSTLYVYDLDPPLSGGP